MSGTEIVCVFFFCLCVFFLQAEDGIRDLVRSRGLGDVYKRQGVDREHLMNCEKYLGINFDEFAKEVIEAMQKI